MRTPILGALLCAVTCPAASAAEYFVSASGADENPGTIEKPFASIQVGLNALEIGDTLFLREGRYAEEAEWKDFNPPWEIKEWTNKKGKKGRTTKPLETSNQVTTIRVYQNERVVLDGTVAIPGEWKIHQGKVWKCRVDQPVWQLFVGEEEMVPARWPNGFFHDDSVFSHDCFAHCKADKERPTHIECKDALPDVDIVGANAILNIGSWSTWARTVKSREGNAFDFEPEVPARAINARENMFFLEGKLGFLDAPSEWHYDQETKTVYLWTPDGKKPANVRGKVMSFALSLDNVSHVTLQGLDFFGTTFRGEECRNITIEDCEMNFPHTSRRMIGEPGTFALTGINASSRDAFRPSRFTLRNCVIRNTDGPAIKISGLGNTIENCLFERIDWSGAHGEGFTIGSRLCSEYMFRRNTIRLTGSSEGVQAGTAAKGMTRHNKGYTLGDDGWLVAPEVSYEEVYPSIMELNHMSDMGKVQSDGAHIQYNPSGNPGTLMRYNWAYGSDKNGLRFDGGGGWPRTPGIQGTIHHNVTWEMRKLSVKNDRNITANNTSFDSSQTDIYIGGSFAPFNAFNTRSFTVNNACDFMTSGFQRKEIGKIPGKDGGNYVGALVKRSVKEHLVDPANYDFRPREGSPLVDAGKVVTGFTPADFPKAPIRDGNVREHAKDLTEGYVGKAPDMGAYEFGDDEYWIPGRQEDRASTPIPPDGASQIPGARDLMFLIGYRGGSADVYAGLSKDAVARATRKSKQFQANLPDPKNILFVEKMNQTLVEGLSAMNRTCFWRVDTVHADGQVVKGDVWSFTTGERESVSNPLIFKQIGRPKQLEDRNWSVTVKGKPGKIHGAFLGLENGMVKIRPKKAGKTRSVSISDLSKADQEYVKSQLED